MLDKKYYVYGANIFHQLTKIGDTEVFRVCANYGFQTLLATNYKICDVGDKFYSFLIDGLKNGDQNTIVESIKYLISLDNSISNDDLLLFSKQLIKESLCGDDQPVLMFATNTIRKHYNHANENFAALFNNIYFVEKINAPLSINNYYIDFDYDDNHERGVDIELVPYPINNNIKLENDGRKVYFNERKKDDYDDIFVHRINDLIISETTSYPKIIVTPEIVGNEYIDEAIKSIADETNNTTCIVCPSYHHIKNGKRYNSSLVITNENRTNKKKRLYKYRGMDTRKDELLEDIDSDSGINLIVINIIGFGRIVFVICRDFLTNDYRNIIRTICPEIVIIQTYTKEFSEFINKSVEYANDRCEIFMINACNAVQGLSECNYVFLEIGRANKRNANVLKNKYECNLCKEKCNQIDRCEFHVKVRMMNACEGKLELNIQTEEIKNGK